MPDTAPRKAKYNRANYDTYIVRIRRGSDLADRMEAHRLDGMSINGLVNTLLSGYFGVPLPLQWYLTRKAEQIT